MQVVFCKFTRLCNHYCNPALEHVITLVRSPIIIVKPHFYPSMPGNLLLMFCFYRFAFSDISYKWNQSSMSGFFPLANCFWGSSVDNKVVWGSRSELFWGWWVFAALTPKVLKGAKTICSSSRTSCSSSWLPTASFAHGYWVWPCSFPAPSLSRPALCSLSHHAQVFVQTLLP